MSKERAPRDAVPGPVKGVVALVGWPRPSHAARAHGNRIWFRLGRSAHRLCGSTTGFALFMFRTNAEHSRCRGTCVVAGKVLWFACGRIDAFDECRIPTHRTKRCRDCEQWPTPADQDFSDPYLNAVRRRYHNQACDQQRCRWDEFCAAQPGMGIGFVDRGL